MKVTTTSPKPSSHSAQNSSAQSRCDFCGMKNHTEANCFKRHDAIKALKQNRKQGSKKGKEKTHAAQEEDSDSAQAAEFAGNASTLDYSTTPTLSPSHAETDWIIDTGATCYMTPNRH